MSPGPLQFEAAQLHVVSWFREDFLRRYPSGEVISEVGYMGRTTRASGSPTPLRTFGRPRLNQVLDALAHDFRRWAKGGDYRKCDVLGLANDGRSAELLEVTTEDNRMSAVTQLTSKLAILRETVNRIHNLSVDWRPAHWRPGPTQLFRVLPSSSHEVVYICYVPTFRAAAPLGVVLYEIHALGSVRRCLCQHRKAQSSVSARYFPATRSRSTHARVSFLLRIRTWRAGSERSPLSWLSPPSLPQSSR